MLPTGDEVHALYAQWCIIGAPQENPKTPPQEALSMELLATGKYGTVEFLLIGNVPSILHGTYHTQTKPHNIPCPKIRENFVGGGKLMCENGEECWNRVFVEMLQGASIAVDSGHFQILEKAIT